MSALDSLLRIVDQQGANELRLGTDKAPSMFAQGAPKKLTMPATSTEALRQLLGELLDDARLAQLDKLGRIELSHDVERLGAFRLTITKRPGAALAIDAIVLRAPVAPRERPSSAAAPPATGATPLHLEPAPLAAPAAPALAAFAAATLAPSTPYRLANTLEALVTRAIGMGASDVHVSEGDPPMARVHGRLVPLDAAISEPLLELARSTVGPALDARLAQKASADVSVDLPGGARGRVNVYATSRGLAMAIRVLADRVPTLGSLGFPIAIDDLGHLPNGLVLVTGATGSGKSTTLAALAQHAIESRSVVCVTLEDPIEYVLSSHGSSLVRQRQIGRDARDFATGLRDALREDPDVLLIGEMRDPESIQLALTAAETGHLVLASLHSRGAVSAIERVIDTYAPERQGQIRVMLADSLRAVVAQRLLPREGGGRALAAEVLRVTASVAASIRDAKPASIKSAMQAGRGEGMIPLERSLADLAKRRVVSLEAARGAANDLSTFTQYMTA
ncbi:MAG: PilT/PilU family type 4a pilus ATPase [Polyangiaceae bacterium]|jgi:twitching motility protein PilT|nr:PilT/PilU family type 4a pilus ATPase [Polyangiaceae bacterium]